MKVILNSYGYKSCLHIFYILFKLLIFYEPFYEIEVSKYLESKWKKLINNKYKNKENNIKVVVKSYSFNNLNFPKAVSNAMNLNLENDD